MDDETFLPPENETPGAGPSPENEPAPQESGPTSLKMDLYFWVQALALALVLLVLTFTFVGRVIRVEGSSMVPTLHEGDLMMLQSVGYTPKQGDVVVLRKPGFPESGTAPVVKRVIATEGQHVVVDYGDHCVYVDGVALDEPYLNEVMNAIHRPEFSALDVVVPQGSIYVLGDNRNVSSDSRNVNLGTVDVRYILGRALVVVFPLRDLGVIH